MRAGSGGRNAAARGHAGRTAGNRFTSHDVRDCSGEREFARGYGRAGGQVAKSLWAERAPQFDIGAASGIMVPRTLYPVCNSIGTAIWQLIWPAMKPQ
jgi:hypothetical protein